MIQNRFLRYAILLIFVCLPGLLLAYFAYHQIYKKGLQAEVHLVTSYIHTLQSAYASEKGSYSTFSNYGAPQQGQDNCMQPEGAAELGFLIPGCHELRATAPRYTFRAAEAESSRSRYRVEALSGSDALGRSFVCFGDTGQEIWESLQNKEIKPIKSCW